MVFRTLKELDQSEGTVQLVDSPDNVHHLHLRGTNIVLVPQPSARVNDPLNWPQWRKCFVYLQVLIFIFFTNASTGGLAPGFYILSLEFNKSINTTTGLLTWPVLTLGLGNFFWVPCALYFGKRPVFITATLLLMIANIWGAKAGTFESLLASRIVGAFAGASTEALGAAIVNDLYFLHERGKMMGLYIIFISWGNSIGPLVGGFIIEGAGWRWHLWVCSIFTAINFISVFLFVPETRFERNVDLGMQPDAASVASEKREVQENTIESATAGSPERRTVGVKKTFLQDINPWSGIQPGSNFFRTFVRPFPLIAYPAVCFAFLGYSVSLGWVIAVGTLYSFVLQSPPYNMSAGISGLINIPAMIGNLFGAFTGGWLTDKYAAYRARKNCGIFVPESRLVLVIISIICVPVGLLMFGFGVERTLSWAVIFVAYGLINVGLTGVANIGMTYVMDSYYPLLQRHYSWSMA